MFPLNWHDPRTGESYTGYRESGFFPEAFINMLAFLGWNPGTTQEIFSKEELIEAFSFERVSKSGAKWDPEKTKWFNQQYLRMKSDEELADIFMKDIEAKGVKASKDYVVKVTGLLKEKAQFVHEFWSLGSYFFVKPDSYDQDVIKKRWNEKTSKFISQLRAAYASLDTFTAAETENTLKAVAEKNELKPGEVMQLYRVCISGVGGGPLIFEMTALLGKEEVVARLDEALEKIK